MVNKSFQHHQSQSLVVKDMLIDEGDAFLETAADQLMQSTTLLLDLIYVAENDATNCLQADCTKKV